MSVFVNKLNTDFKILNPKIDRGNNTVKFEATQYEALRDKLNPPIQSKGMKNN